jgi:hypothetical protein
MQFDVLAQFAQWFVWQKVDSLIPVAVYNYGQTVSLVLFRQPPFQVEMFIVVPGGGFPEEHRHPNVDSYEVDLYGDIQLSVNGVRAVPVAVPRSNGNAKPIYFTRVTEKDFHGAESMSAGGAFLSIQHWLNGKDPSSVGLDWVGSAVSAEHERLLDPFRHGSETVS